MVQHKWEQPAGGQQAPALLLLCLVLRLEVRGHRDGRQRWTRAPWPHLDGARPGIVEAGPKAPSGSLLQLRRATRGCGALS